MITIRIKYIHLLGATALFLLIFAAAAFLFKSEELPAQTAERVKAVCLNQALGKETCYAKEFRKLAEIRGPEYAFDALDALQKIDSDAKGCHLIAHGIGLSAYKRAPQNWQEMIQTINPSCSYGAIHGIIENYVSSLPDRQAGLPERALTSKIIPTLCGETPRADCNHIVGHLLLVETRGDIDKALKLCSVFARERELNFCLTGVFMEYQTAVNLVEHGYADSSWLNWPARLPELEKICRKYNGKAGEACWEEIAHAAAVKFNNDPKNVFGFCGSAQLQAGAKRCRRHAIGIIAASYNFELENLKKMCTIKQVYDPDFEKDCYVGLAASTLATIPGASKEVKNFLQNIHE